jgi:hypothetical protein
MTDFGAFNLNNLLLRTLRESNILFPNHLQAEKIIDSGFISRAIILTTTQETSFSIENKIRKLARLPGVKILAVAPGIENVEARYAFFSGEEDFPHILIGQPSPVKHFINATGYDMSRVDSLLLVVDADSPQPDFEKFAGEIVSRAKQECQRILLTSRSDDPPYGLIESVLRSPAIFYESSGRQEDRPGEEEAGEETVDHRLYMILEPLKAADFTSIIRAEAAGRTLVVLEERQQAEDWARSLQSGLGDWPVFSLWNIDRSRALPPSVIVVADPSILEEGEPPFNAIILKPFPRNYEDYLRYMRLLKREHGDRIASLATSREISGIFNLKLHYGIRLKEIMPPTSRQVKSEKEAELVKKLAAAASRPSEEMISLLRRIRTSPTEESILAESVRRMVREVDRSEPAPSPPAPAPEPKRPERPDIQPRPSKAPPPGREADSRERPRPARPSQRPQYNLVEVKLNAGKADGLDPGFLVQWLQSRLAMRASEFGAVQVFDSSSTVFIPQERVADATVILSGLRFGSKVVEVQVMPSKQGRRK